jgi:hypothetical protein
MEEPAGSSVKDSSPVFPSSENITSDDSAAATLTLRVPFGGAHKLIVRNADSINAVICFHFILIPPNQTILLLAPTNHFNPAKTITHNSDHSIICSNRYAFKYIIILNNVIPHIAFSMGQFKNIAFFGYYTIVNVL